MLVHVVSAGKMSMYMWVDEQVPTCLHTELCTYTCMIIAMYYEVVGV